MKVEKLSVVADRGYYSGPELRDCEQVGITTYVPKTDTSGNEKKGLFTKTSFIYEPEHDRYRCPAGEHLIHRHRTFEDGNYIHVYWAPDPICRACTLRAQCTSSRQSRRIRRWEHEACSIRLKHVLMKRRR